MTKTKYTKISKYEKFIDELQEYIKEQRKGYGYLQKGYSNITFREIFQTLDFMNMKIEKFKDKI